MIRYIGNKSELSDFILPFCPKNPKYWIEPFGGSMGLFFSLNLRDYPDTQFIYNDINPYNSNLFSFLKKDKFIERVLNTNLNESLFVDSFDKLNSRSKEDKALSWLIILFSSSLKDLMNKKYHGNVQFEIFKNKIPYYRNYFNRIEVNNIEYKKIIQKYDTGSDTFIYLDPPYKGFSQYYTNHNFTDNSHSILRDFLFTIKSDWILSYYNFPELKDWYNNYKIVNKKHNLSDEYLIMNLNY